VHFLLHMSFALVLLINHLLKSLLLYKRKTIQIQIFGKLKFKAGASETFVRYAAGRFETIIDTMLKL